VPSAVVTAAKNCGKRLSGTHMFAVKCARNLQPDKGQKQLLSV
jgi:hypothetical protein